jgi:hypothetical protein
VIEVGTVGTNGIREVVGWLALARSLEAVMVVIRRRLAVILVVCGLAALAAIFSASAILLFGGRLSPQVRGLSARWLGVPIDSERARATRVSLPGHSLMIEDVQASKFAVACTMVLEQSRWEERVVCFGHGLIRVEVQLFRADGTTLAGPHSFLRPIDPLHKWPNRRFIFSTALPRPPGARYLAVRLWNVQTPMTEIPN